MKMLHGLLMAGTVFSSVVSIQVAAAGIASGASDNEGLGSQANRRSCSPKQQSPRRSRKPFRRSSLPLRPKLLPSLRHHRPLNQSRRRRLQSRRSGSHRRQQAVQLRRLHKAHLTSCLRLYKVSRLQYPVDQYRHRLPRKLFRTAHHPPRRASHLLLRSVPSHRLPLRCRHLRLLHRAHLTLHLRRRKNSRPPVDQLRRRRLRKRYRLAHQVMRCRRLVLRLTCRKHRSSTLACRHPRHSKRDRSPPQRQEQAFRRNQRKDSRCGGWTSCG